jgi:hypothetical protein
MKDSITADQVAHDLQVLGAGFLALLVVGAFLLWRVDGSRSTSLAI